MYSTYVSKYACAYKKQTQRKKKLQPLERSGCLYLLRDGSQLFLTVSPAILLILGCKYLCAYLNTQKRETDTES